MRIRPELFWEALIIYEECNKSGKPFSRNLLIKKLGISEMLARQIQFAIENRDIISSKFIHLGEKTKKALVTADLHIPFQDNLAVELALSEGEKEKVDTVILLGDVIDFYQISVFPKLPRPDIQDEINSAQKFFRELRDRFKNAEIIYIEGNHEKRLQTYILENAQELYPLLEDTFEWKYGLNDLNIKYTYAPIKIGKLSLLHGHEINERVKDLVNIANYLWRNLGTHAIAGHFHKDDLKVFRTLDDTYVVCALGYLASNMEYKKINSWTQSFALIDFYENGYFAIRPRKIVDGMVF